MNKSIFNSHRPENLYLEFDYHTILSVIKKDKTRYNIIFDNCDNFEIRQYLWTVSVYEKGQYPNTVKIYSNVKNRDEIGKNIITTVMLSTIINNKYKELGIKFERFKNGDLYDYRRENRDMKGLTKWDMMTTSEKSDYIEANRKNKIRQKNMSLTTITKKCSNCTYGFTDALKTRYICIQQKEFTENCSSFHQKYVKII